MKILVASSDIDLTEYIYDALNICQPDWELSITDSGKQCLETVRNGNCPDIILLGIKIDVHCLKLIEMIRDCSDVLIIVFSGDKDIDTLTKAFNAGANDYIVKPFNKSVFIARLKALYRRRVWDTQAIEKIQESP
ncbi:MAG: response regulator [Dehalococcoidales bacterium]|nr:response regulator [Dehalococcoidales bacterium]